MNYRLMEKKKKNPTLFCFIL